MIQKSNLAQAFRLCQYLVSPFRATKSQLVTVIAVTFSLGGFSQPKLPVSKPTAGARQFPAIPRHRATGKTRRAAAAGTARLYNM